MYRIVLSREEQERIYKIITDDKFPDEQIHFNEEFHESGRQYFASGCAVVEGYKYNFSWSEEWGIAVDSIEREMNNEKGRGGK